MKRSIIIIFIAFLWPTFCFAIDNETWKTDLIRGSFNKSSRTEREIIAKGLLKEIQQINDYIPSLKPAEEEWLKKEFDAALKLEFDAMSKKTARLVATPEWKIRNIKAALREIIESLECVLTDSTNNKHEIYCWGKVNLLLTNDLMFNNTIQTLDSTSKVDFSDKIRKQFNLIESRENPWKLYSRWGRAIQEHIVLFMLSQ